MSASRMFLKKPKRAKIPREIRMAGTYWNGEPALCRRVQVVMGKSDPKWWSAGMEGQTREAVRIEYHGEVFYIDNQGGHGNHEPGDGWLKVTLGMGGPDYAHASIANCTEIG